MTIYWLLFGYAAVMALAYPTRLDRRYSAVQLLAMAGFVLSYTLISLLRYEIGGDWRAYWEMYEYARIWPVSQLFELADPGFAILLWISAALGSGIYAVNALCSFILAYGVARVSLQTREPWLAIVMAVPYILIVVGLGYVRQAAALGFILLAIDAVGRHKARRAATLLVAAVLFHSTAVVAWPFFAWALANRNKLQILLLTTVGAVITYFAIGGRLERWQANYLEDEYSSSGALVRLLMGLLPALLLLLRRSAFHPPERARSIWIGFALANVALLVAWVISPSSTAVDRIALYFTVVQLLTFGEMAPLLGFSNRSGFLVRLLVIGYASAVQLVWLAYATHAEAWVPYKSLLRYL